MAALGIISYQARVIWRVVRERNCSQELCRREQQLHMQKQSETLRKGLMRQNELISVLVRAFASAQPATLEDLLKNETDDWSLKSSDTPRSR